MYGVPKPFSVTCHGHGNIALTVEGCLDLARRLVQRFQISKTILRKIINKKYKYFASYFWISVMGSELMTYQKFWMNLTSPWLARGARWPPTPTCSWWWTWATLQWLFSKFFSGSDDLWSRDTLVTIFRFSYHFQTYGDHMSSPLKFISRFWHVPFWEPSRSHASVHVRSTWH